MINRFMNWFDETPLWHWFAKKVLAHLTFRIWGYPRFSYGKTEHLQSVLLSTIGDKQHLYCFVATDRATLASILIRRVSKSRWSHGGIVLPGDFMSCRTLHMKGKGLIYEHIFATLRECDDFALIKIPITDYERVLKNIVKYIEQKDKLKYDYEQELESDASSLEQNDIYCSELIWMVAKDDAKLHTSKVLGRNCFSPDDVYKSGEVIFEYTI